MEAGTQAMDDAPQTGQKSGNQLRRWLPLGIIATVLVGLYASGATQYLSVESLTANKAMIDSFVAENYLLAVLTYLAVYVVAVSVSFPGASFLTLAGGAIFGWFMGGTLTVFAATIGASIIFLVAKTALGDVLAQKAGPRMNKLRDGFQADAFNYLLTLRIAPVVPFWITNLAPALFGMDLRRYVIATFVGIIPGTYAYSFIGDQIGAAVGADSSGLVQSIVLGLGALAFASVIPVVWKQVRKRSSRKTDN